MSLATTCCDPCCHGSGARVAPDPWIVLPGADPVPVPEPGTLLLLGGGLLVLGIWHWIRCRFQQR